MEILRSIDRDRVRDLQQRGELFWLDLVDPDPDELAAVQDLVTIHPLALQASREFGQRVKFDTYDKSALLVCYGATSRQDGRPRLVEVHMHLSKDALVTITREPLPAVIDVRHAFAEGIATSHPVYQVLETLSMSLLRSLDRFDDAIDSLEEELVERTTTEHRQRIFRLRRRLARMRRIVLPQRDLIVTVQDGLIEATAHDDRGFARERLRDIGGHLDHAAGLIDSYREQLQGLLDLYLAEVSNGMNQVMKRLTLIATVFLPLTFLTGFFGMNFGWLVDGLAPAWTFWVFGIGSLAVSTLAVAVYLRRRG